MKISELEKTNRYVWGSTSRIQFENNLDDFHHWFATELFKSMERAGCDTMEVTKGGDKWFFRINYDVHPELNKFC